MNFFERGENAMNPEETISGDDVHYHSEENIKMTWMCEKRIKLFMQMELENCRNKLRLHSRQFPRRGLPHQSFYPFLPAIPKLLRGE